jgi:galactokinase
MDASAASASAGFRNSFGYDPAGVWSAPGRVNLIGEHTDYNEGFVLPFAINRRTFAAIALRSDSVARVASSLGGEPIEIPIPDISAQSVSGWSAYPLGVAYALAEAGAAPSGFDLYVSSSVPVGAGLSSSAAIECSVALGLNELWSGGLSLTALAKVGQRAENEIVGAPTGIMDQTASLMGVADSVVFLDCRSLEATAIPLGLEKFGLEVLIIDTQVSHRLNDGGYATRRAACEAGAKSMGVSSLRDLSPKDLDRARTELDDVVYRRVRHVVTENQRVLETVDLLRTKGPKFIGELLYASHESMRDDFEISIDELDTAVDTAIKHGSIGARMTGGGFGGAAIALVEAERVSEVTLAVRAEFEALGYSEPDIFPVLADQGACREL